MWQQPEFSNVYNHLQQECQTKDPRPNAAPRCKWSTHTHTYTIITGFSKIRIGFFISLPSTSFPRTMTSVVSAEEMPLNWFAPWNEQLKLWVSDMYGTYSYSTWLYYCFEIWFNHGLVLITWVSLRLIHNPFPFCKKEQFSFSASMDTTNAT